MKKIGYFFNKYLKVSYTLFVNSRILQILSLNVCVQLSARASRVSLKNICSIFSNTLYLDRCGSGCIKSRTKHKPSYALHARLTIVIHAWLPKNSTMPLSPSNYLSLYEALAFAKCIDNIIVMTLIFAYTYIIYMINRLKRWSVNQDNIYLCILALHENVRDAFHYSDAPCICYQMLHVACLDRCKQA